MISKELRNTLKKYKIDIEFNFNNQEIENKKIVIEDKLNEFKPVNYILVNFLCFFLDKKILYKSKFGYDDDINFNLDNALSYSYAMKTIESKFDLKNIIPFGEMNRGHMSLIIDEHDNVYAVMDNLLIHYGNDPFDALTNILNHKELGRVDL